MSKGLDELQICDEEWAFVLKQLFMQEGVMQEVVSMTLAVGFPSWSGKGS